MGKILRNTHISGEAGVLKFAEFCNRHKPYIFFREVLKSDFGIDGEIELTRTNEQNKIEPLGEIIKVQIKTVSSENSYIRNEKNSTFEFYPRKDDIEYWDKYKKNGIEILLVIYDLRIDALYCKKLLDTDVFIGKESLKIVKRKNTNAITFHKEDNLLKVGINDFTLKFSASFKSRINFDIKEYLTSNFMKYKQHPRQMYVYECLFKNKKAIYEVIEQLETPFFVVYNSIVYTAFELGREYASFKSKVLKDVPAKLITYTSILDDRVLRNHYIELLNEYLKFFLRTKKLAFKKDYSRYYFWIGKDQNEVKVTVTTRKRGQRSEKHVVKKFDYPKFSFYRHVALQCKHLFIENDVYLIIHPKYYFTKDGKTPVEPKLITKLTNFLTSQEYNNHFCDWLHFWWSYLSVREEEIVVYEDPIYKTTTDVQRKNFYSRHVRLCLSQYNEFQVPFGIANDKKDRRKVIETNTESPQKSLFDYEN
ncbi:MAG TPA: DUF4365 domain-containing protein [Hanamia sp.]|nr:DUF4365 domain-containing protein [Hanamia sp.]